MDESRPAGQSKRARRKRTVSGNKERYPGKNIGILLVCVNLAKGGMLRILRRASIGISTRKECQKIYYFQ